MIIIYISLASLVYDIMAGREEYYWAVQYIVN
jgi:hypothetical protein